MVLVCPNQPQNSHAQFRCLDGFKCLVSRFHGLTPDGTPRLENISETQIKELKKQKQRNRTHVSLKTKNKNYPPAVCRHTLVAAVLFVPVLAVHCRVVATTSHAHTGLSCILKNRSTQEKHENLKHRSILVLQRQGKKKLFQQGCRATEIIPDSTIVGFGKCGFVKSSFLLFKNMLPSFGFWTCFIGFLQLLH